ncbi:hypothetical protein SAMN04489712_104155 [Thermomonospora echinospora]|uniref:Transcriptional regulator n=2 Tax=Thermomonospora echinospora TaxID=1992 RepID=A0A1H5YRZ5_9ACTN|nr:hypothetical protein SAMN04489712_104155 [Thermomonospora echinospora]
MADSTFQPRTPLAQLMALVGWNGDRLARGLNAFAQAQGRPERLHPKTPYKWVRGETPRSPWRALTAALLSDALQRPVTTAELGWPEDDLQCVSAITGLQVPWTTSGTLRGLRTVTDAGPMDRRLFLMLLGAAATSPAHEWLIARQVGDTGRASGAPVPLEVADRLDQIAGHLRRMDDQLGGGQLLTLVHQHLRYVTGLLDERRYSDTVGRRLHATAAELLRLAGFICFDSGLHARAQRYWVTALHAAHTAGDRALGANILGFWSCQAKDIGQIREAITLAETARTGYPGASPKVSAILELRKAEAYANDHAATDTRRAIDTAFDTLTGAPASTGHPDWAYWMDEAHAHAQAGYCYLRLGDHSRARAHLRSGLRLQGAGYSREGALRRVLLATSYVQQEHPNLDAGLAQAHQALDTLTGEVDSARCLGHLSHLVDHLTPHRRSPEVREFIDRARPLMSPAR